MAQEADVEEADAQWMRAVKDADRKLLILVCKQHDGLCVWPSHYTARSAAAIPWRGVKGNEAREVAEVARRHGIKLGVYLSPADLYQLRTNPRNPDLYAETRARRSDR